MHTRIYVFKKLKYYLLNIYFTILYREGDIDRDCPYMCIA